MVSDVSYVSLSTSVLHVLIVHNYQLKQVSATFNSTRLLGNYSQTYDLTFHRFFRNSLPALGFEPTTFSLGLRIRAFEAKSINIASLIVFSLYNTSVSNGCQLLASQFFKRKSL